MAESSDALWHMLANGLFEQKRLPQKRNEVVDGHVNAPAARVSDTLSQGYQRVSEGKGLDPLFAPRVAGGLFGMMASPATIARDEIMGLLPAPSQFTWDPTQPYRPTDSAGALLNLLNLPQRRARR
jgi:hypothetical protein